MTKLAQSGAEYLVVGGVAANLHGISGGTKDIDLLIPKDLANTEKLLGALGQLTWGIAKEITAEEVLGKPFTIIGDQPRVDLLLQAGKLFYETVRGRPQVARIRGVPFPYVSLADLIRSKETDRPEDVLMQKKLTRLRRR